MAVKWPAMAVAAAVGSVFAGVAWDQREQPQPASVAVPESPKPIVFDPKWLDPNLTVQIPWAPPICLVEAPKPPPVPKKTPHSPRLPIPKD